jgi:hypothetical protein
MSKKTNGADELYATHLGGYGYRANAAVNREGMIERMYWRVLYELATNRFNWSGMPPEIDVRWLETTLFRQGAAVFHHDPQYEKYFALQLGSIGQINMTNNPLTLRAIGNGYSKGLYNATIVANKTSAIPRGNDLPGVPIWANYARMPDVDIVSIYANRLANFDRTVEINSNSARTPRVIVTDANSRLSMENINRQVDEGQNAIRVTNSGIEGIANIQVFDMGINPDTIEKIDIVRARHWNVCMGLLGIENANQDKKERLVESEVGANDEQTDSMKFVNLNARQQAAEWINKVFGLDVSVEYNTKVAERADQIFDALLTSEPGSNVSETERVDA